MQQKHYSEIDGLRAVAVAAVVLYHLGLGFSNGGYKGVDVFFVISGFVVSLSMSTVGTATLRGFTREFYLRRLLRIAPALVACLVVTTLLSCMFIPPAWLSDANQYTALTAFVGLSNFELARPQNAYFSPKAEFNPFTHTWSLGVEEQFYVLFPLLFYFYLRSGPGTLGRRAALAALAAASIASIALCAVWTAGRPTFAFYLTPARFWELGCGMALFITRDAWLPSVRALSARSARCAGWVAVIGVLASLMNDDGAAFPFPGAVLPVLSTAAVLLLSFARQDAVPAWLRAAPMRWLGKVSFSLYLWHWPVLVLLRWTVGVEGVGVRVLAVVLSLLLATVSYHGIERPALRLRHLHASRPYGMIAAALGTVGLGSLLSALVFSHQSEVTLSVAGNPATWAAPPLAGPAGSACKAGEKWSGFEGGSEMVIAAARGCGPEAGAGRLFVAGDSHTLAYLPLLHSYAQRTGREVHMLAKGGCAVFDLIGPVNGADATCGQFMTTAMQKISAEMRGGDVLFLSSLRIPRLSNQSGLVTVEAPNAGHDESRRRALTEATDFLRGLADRHIAVVFEMPKPMFKAPPFRCLDWFNRRNPVCAPGFAIDRSMTEASRRPVVEAIAEMSNGLRGALPWDPLPTLCSASVCSAFVNGRPAFFDGDHLGELGNSVLLPSFTAHMSRAFLAAR